MKGRCVFVAVTCRLFSQSCRHTYVRYPSALGVDVGAGLGETSKGEASASLEIAVCYTA